MADIRKTGVLDDCQRPDESPLSHGGDWAPAVRPTYGWNGYAPGLQLFHNAIMNVGVITNSVNVSYWKSAVFHNPVEVWGRAGAGFDLSEGLRLYMNMLSPEGNVLFSGYALEMGAPVVGSSYWTIFRYDPDGGQAGVVAVNSGFPGTDELVLFRNIGGNLEDWRDLGTNGAFWTFVCGGFDPTYDFGYIGLATLQDDNNPSWTEFGGGQIRRTQIYRILGGTRDYPSDPKTPNVHH